MTDTKRLLNTKILLKRNLENNHNKVEENPKENLENPKENLENPNENLENPNEKPNEKLNENKSLFFSRMCTMIIEDKTF